MINFFLKSHIAKADTDGYILLYSPIGFAINPTLFTKVNYKIGDFVAVSYIGGAPLVLVEDSALPARNTISGCRQL